MSEPRPHPRPSHRSQPRLLPVVGGTDPADVAALRDALAALLAGRSRHTLLVPVGPHEDPDVVRADVEARIARTAGLPGLPLAADVLLRTSGSSTGTGALIAMGAVALVASARASHARLGGPGTWVLALPVHHVAGLQVLVRGLVAGTRPVVVDTASGFRPAALARATDRARERAGGAPVYVSLVPTQLVRVLGDPRATAALAGVSAVLVGGAATDPGLLERARGAGIRVVTTYGMSETGGGCVYDGVPLDGVRVRIADPGPDGAGRIVLSGPVLAEARIAPPGRDSESRDGTVEGLRELSDGGREFVTADRGRLVAGTDGVAQSGAGTPRLHVLGRLDDVVVTGGVKVDPHEVERALAALPDVAEACAVGVPDAGWGSAVVAAVVLRPGGRADAEELRRAARAMLDGPHAPKRIEIVGALPLRGPGKVDRRAVAARMAARSAPGAAAPDGDRVGAGHRDPSPESGTRGAS